MITAPPFSLRMSGQLTGGRCPRCAGAVLRGDRATPHHCLVCGWEDLERPAAAEVEAETRQPRGDGCANPSHGTCVLYDFGCRCDACREAKRTAKRRQRRRGPSSGGVML